MRHWLGLMVKSSRLRMCAVVDVDAFALEILSDAVETEDWCQFPSYASCK